MRISLISIQSAPETCSILLTRRKMVWLGDWNFGGPVFAYINSPAMRRPACGVLTAPYLGLMRRQEPMGGWTRFDVLSYL